MAPGRPPELQIQSARGHRVPPPVGMLDPAQRVRILHALANHELQAVELFAWAVVAFPDAPMAFRRGLVAIIRDEQRHLRLYMERIAAHGRSFGDIPVTGHFWNNIADIHTPLQFLCTMGLTFENANLDFANEYAKLATRAGDNQTAEVLARVHQDEIRHVHFAWTWLAKLKSRHLSSWDAYLANVTWPLGPHRARGKEFDIASRQAAGLDNDFIERLQHTEARRPGGAKR